MRVRLHAIFDHNCLIDIRRVSFFGAEAPFQGAPTGPLVRHFSEVPQKRQHAGWMGAQQIVAGNVLSL